MQIYVARNGQQTGPYELEALRAGLGNGSFQPTELAWYEGAPGWVPLNAVPGLTNALPPTPAAVPPSIAPPMEPAGTGGYQPADLSPYGAAGGYQPAGSPPGGNYQPAGLPSGGGYQPAGSQPPGPGGAYYPGTPQPQPGPGGGYPADRPEAYGTNKPKKTFWGVVGSILAIPLGLLGIFGRSHHGTHYGSSYHSPAYSTPSYHSPAHSTPASTSASALSASSPHATPAATVPSVTIIATRHYVNDRSKFTGALAEHFVDFSFDYPATWTLEPDTTNFVTVTHKGHTASGSPYDAEKFSVGYFYEPGGNAAKSLPTSAAGIIKKLEAAVVKGWPNCQTTGGGESYFGAYTSYAFGYTSHVVGTKTTMDLWGRDDLFAPTSGPNGVVAILIATSLSTQVHGVDELGSKGDQMDIVGSFKFGH